jgi:vitamin B12 transporter
MRKLFLAATLLSSGISFSQSVIDLNPITVISTRTPQKISETGRNITILDGSLFAQMPVNSVDELLRYVPGVEMQQRGAAGSQADIVIRGGTFQQVLVLIDGIKINDPLTGHFSGYMPITPTEIARIEILRGPAAAIYGAEAVGGVINIITKTFSTFNEEKSSTTNAGFSLGDFGFGNMNLGYYKTSKKLNLSVGALTNNAEGHPLRGNNKGYFNNHTLSASAAIALKNDWKLMLRSSLDSRKFAAQNFYTTFTSDTATEKVESFWNQVKISKQTEKSTNDLDIAYKSTTDHYLFNPRAIANNNQSNYWVIQYIHGANINQDLKLNYGVLLDRRAIESNDRGNHNTYHGAVFSNALYRKGNLRLSPGLRIDMDENYGTEIIPQANASYQMDKVNFRANAGRAIRSADFTERFNNYNKVIVNGGSIGNPDLTAEKSWSYEAGADLLLKKIKISATYFYRDQNDIIDWITTPYAQMPRKSNLNPAGTFALSKNIKEVNTSGIELETSYSHSFSDGHSIYVNLGATFLSSKSSDATPSFYIVSHAKTLIQSSLIYTIRNITISTNSIYKERNGQKASGINAEISKNYFMMNGRLQYAFSKKVNAFASTTNLGNISYSDLLGSRMPGRWTTAGVNVKL